MLRQLDDTTLVSGQIAPEDMPALKDQGVSLIINNRPDGEDPGQPLAADIEAAAEAAGIAYRFVPITRGMGPADVDCMREAMDAADGKVLAFCRSGSRSTMAWALARREQGVSREEVEAAAERAGISIAAIAHLL